MLGDNWISLLQHWENHVTANSEAVFAFIFWGKEKKKTFLTVSSKWSNKRLPPEIDFGYTFSEDFEPHYSKWVGSWLVWSCRLYRSYLNTAGGETVCVSSVCRINLGRIKQLSGQGPDPGKSHLKKAALFSSRPLVASYHYKLYQSSNTLFNQHKISSSRAEWRWVQVGCKEQKVLKSC